MKNWLKKMFLKNKAKTNFFGRNLIKPFENFSKNDFQLNSKTNFFFNSFFRTDILNPNFISRSLMGFSRFHLKTQKFPFGNLYNSTNSLIPFKLKTNWIRNFSHPFVFEPPVVTFPLKIDNPYIWKPNRPPVHVGRNKRVKTVPEPRCNQ